MGNLPEKVRVRLSKRLSGLLRHYGPKYGLNLDREGWARIDDVVSVLRGMPGYDWVSRSDILEIARRDDKGRFEVRGDMIRARYGHSIRWVKPSYDTARPSTGRLYHGTPTANLKSILSLGILPGKRHYVHLTTTPELAYQTGRRHGRPVAILDIDINCLEEKKIPLYSATPIIYVAPRIPPECIRIAEIRE